MCTLALLGTAISVGGALVQGAQQQQLANYQAKAYEQQAQADAQSAAFEQRQERRRQDLLEAQARAQAGASGVGIAGSPTEVLAANARQGQVDLNATRYSSKLRQNNLNTQAAISRFQGKQAMTASIFKAGGSLIDGLSGLYDPARSVTFGGSSLSPRAAGP
ncbi:MULTISPECIES: hypothetical protein [unclassified Mesorhizobium]|uniref:hypothetical protein n=1 Tax=unclassified Mesorhizobium TaxID=325217 RepID=UPI000FCBDB02|nr:MULTISPECIES: hypothetical protein [unclassified Mesorhizobium]TGP27251.1 hypothetical protein EN874_006405 [Mesorhizobium sp. M1D.F.Ca.ET.231.01.1.1]TGP39209.1 hypothetical protein EN877_06405 [Mesorhizobium sp. M1D.F.Ca.ET.234.01.1.1]TGS51418.1 hypothetical protein EN827_06405 [Mesorhizobium sp. M1D.F.Ca.ET.184.01.1.1]TGS67302.1 hypothetical protein EN826_006405 [Mesorhizobium sp. M1D.F.Ca.ET.183.01.1.1]